MTRRPLRNPRDRRTRGRPIRRSGPPRWYERHSDATACDCTDEAETVRSTTGYSDVLYLLFRCPDCGSRWTGGIEG
jgi:hypothetical protein